jgi:methylenetetrahydrofolate reductase (NADPH)
MNKRKKMTLIEYLTQEKQTYFSFELLPPLKGGNIEDIYRTIDPLMEFDPININVTYHQEETIYKKLPNGLMQRKTVRKRPGTVAISAAIKYRYQKPIVVPHLICGGFSKEDTENALIDLHFLGMTNLLVLRGDPPKTQRYFTPEKDGHEHTIDLIHQIVNMNNGRYLDDELQNTTATNFTFGVAGYPEKHSEAPNLTSDLKYLKQKVDAGAQFIVTQMFFDNQKYFKFVELCRENGITVPIVPGIKPIRTRSDIRLLPKVFNIDIPEELINETEKVDDDKKIREIGVDWSVKQSLELKKAGVPVIHYYTIGDSSNIREIAKRVF